MKSPKSGVPGACCACGLRGLLWGLAALVLLACRTSGTPEQAGLPPEAAPDAGVSAKDAGRGETGPGEGAGPESPAAASLAQALCQAQGELSANIPGPASVAVISIASADPDEGEFAVEELTFLLVNSKKYRIVDRRSLDAVRAEQNFQLSGEVDDSTAVSIGHLIGAAVVITGSISPYDSAKYLRLKALDVETGQIRAMSSRRFNGF